MNRLRLLQRNLLHFRGVNLAVIAGMAVATAVLSGAMMVGDSVRGSLRELTLQRLGNIDYAIISTRFFDDSLANRVLAAAPISNWRRPRSFKARHPTNQPGFTPLTCRLPPGRGLNVDRGKCVINGELADSLGIKSPGATLLFSLPNGSDAPREGALDRRSRGDTISDLRVEVSNIVREPGVVSLFNPNGGQRAARNAWVSLSDLQDAIDRPGGINALMAHRRSGKADAAGLTKLNDAVAGVVALDDYGLTRTSGASEPGVASTSPSGAAREADSTEPAATQTSPVEGPPASPAQVQIASRSTYIAPPIVEAADAAAKSLGVPLQKISVNLLTSVSAAGVADPGLKSVSVGVADPRPGSPTPATETTPGPTSATSLDQSGERLPSTEPTLTPTLSRSTGRGGNAANAGRALPANPDSVAGVADPGSASTTPPSQVDQPPRVIHYAVAAGVSDLDGHPLAANEMAVNQWTADQLGVKAGDPVTIDFYERAPNGELRNASASHPSSDLTFIVAHVLPMEGIGADPTLPPDYKGLTDADSVANWNPPEGLKIDKSLVTKDDEAYWKDYRAAPKIFVSFDTARNLWGGVYGDVTGLRVPAEKADAFCDALQKKISPASMQMTFRAIKSEQLAAAGSGTDFGEYFLYFSFFLIVAAVLLVAMLFRLGIEQRARQLGLLSAVGFPPAIVRRLALAEGLILALIGGAIGSIGAVAYTWLIIAGLRTWWVGAVGTTAMHLYVKPLTLIIGYLSGVIVAMLAVWWAAWRVGRVPVASLLSGSWENQPGRTRPTGRVLRVLGMICVLCGLAALALAAFKRQAANEAFLAGGSLLLCGSLTWLAGALHARPLHARPWQSPRRPRVSSPDQKKPIDIPTPPSPARTLPSDARAGSGELAKSSSGNSLRSQHGLEARATIHSLFSLGIRNATRHTARSVLSVGLIAFAVFTLIVAAGMRQVTSSNGDDKKSGTGGYRLVLKAAIPIFGDLNTAEGRKLAGIRYSQRPNLVRSSVHSDAPVGWSGHQLSESHASDRPDNSLGSPLDGAA